MLRTIQLLSSDHYLFMNVRPLFIQRQQSSFILTDTSPLDFAPPQIVNPDLLTHTIFSGLIFVL